MEQTPDFFNTAEEGWIDGIVVQNRELFICYAVRMLYNFNHNGLKTSGLSAAQGGVPIPPTSNTAVLVVTKGNVDKALGAPKK
jgi:ABC-type sugar transport system substrate-binding protein